MPSEARAELLHRVVEHFLAAGRTDDSLRSVATAIGSSHRMLLYHFGSADTLLDEVVGEVEARQRSALGAIAAEDADLPTIARRFWRVNSAGDLAPLVRLFFTLYARLLERGDTERAAGLVTAWVTRSSSC